VRGRRAWLGALVVVVGCSGAATPDSAGDQGQSSGGSDAGDRADAEGPREAAAPADDAGTGFPAPAEAGPCAPGTCATVQGMVKRRAGVKPQAGGKGHIYISIFDGDPVADRKNAKAIAAVIVKDTDMNADDAAVAYAIHDVPVRAAHYTIIAFLDDNKTASQNPGPDKGDLLSLDGFSAPRITVDKPAEMPFDITLSTYLPF
jgi:hypothetical protein